MRSISAARACGRAASVIRKRNGISLTIRPARHRHAEPVLHDQKVRRALPTGERRDEPEENPGRRDQEGEAEGSRCMRHAQERRNKPLEHGKEPRAAPARDEKHHHGKGDGGGGEPGEEAEKRGAKEARRGEERARRRRARIPSPSTEVAGRIAEGAGQARSTEERGTEKAAATGSRSRTAPSLP